MICSAIEEGQWASSGVSCLEQDPHCALAACLCRNMQGCDATGRREVHIYSHVYQTLQELIGACNSAINNRAQHISFQVLQRAPGTTQQRRVNEPVS